MGKTWTLKELAEESQRFVDDGDSRRVQWKPSGRQIRYYSTLGILDKPDTDNGRTVWYGPRHLLQLLAIKRLQQDGLTLAEIQRSLAGAKPERLREIADLPQRFLETLHNSVKTAPSPRRSEAFWTQRPTPSPTLAPPPAFQLQWTLEIAPGVHLTVDAKQFPSPDDQCKRDLAQAFLSVWREQQSKNTKENP